MECKEGRNHDKTPGYSCINRNIVECKVRIILSCLDCPDCINRNIVECKEITIHLHSEHGLRINRNIVECKETGVLTQPVNPGVLIETLWNVKMCSTYSAQPLLTVLIETLWNVKSGLL